MKFINWLKEKLKIESLQKFNLNQKTATNLVIIICIGITFLIVSSFVSDMHKSSGGEEQSGTDAGSQVESEAYAGNSGNEYVRNLENQLSSILSKIEDAGKVSVMITLKSSSEIIPAKDESLSNKITNEKDTDGGTRTINEENTSDKVVFANAQSGDSKPLIVKEINPEIKGVIVVAEGAKDAKVKLKISQAVQTVLDVPAYRVTVYERN